MTRTRPTNRRQDGRIGRSLLALVALAIMLALVALMGSACSQSSTPSTSQSAAPTDSTQSTTDAGAIGGSSSTDSSATNAPAQPAEKVQIKDTKVGKGATAKVGDNVSVDYTGWLMDGTKFDSSIGKAPFAFTIGAGQVIEGWDQGVAGMKVGGTRVLIIPSSLGYGPQGYPPTIPGSATLKFEVKLLAVRPGQ
jgi:FKBP-type peptidyl-prolyl cis-trans isomerase